jgi:phosphoglycolate phosphatase
VTRLAIFDCDGTLIDSQISICLAMEGAFARSGITPPPRASIRRIVGLSLVEAVAALLPDATPERHAHVAADYKRAFWELRAAGQIDEPLFDGITDLLDALRAEGWLLGVATGKSDRGLALALDHHGLTDYFVTLQTADRHPSKPHPSMVVTAMAEAGADPAETVVIGDTSFDIAMALNAETRAVGVAWGYHDTADLVRAGAHAVARRPADLTELLEAV